MEEKVAKAHLKQLRMTPRKVKIVLDLIRNKNVAEAAAILKNTNKIACESVEKLLNQRWQTQRPITTWTLKSFTCPSALSLPECLRVRRG